MLIDQNNLMAGDIFDFPDFPFTTGPRPWPVGNVEIGAASSVGTISIVGSVTNITGQQNSDQTPLIGE